MKLAFVGIGQAYPSHVWMTRMRHMLADNIVVNIDDQRNQQPGTRPSSDTLYLPRKLSRSKRILRAAGLISTTDARLRSQCLLQAITRSDATTVLVNFLDYATQFDDVWRQINIPVVVHCHGYDITWDVRHHLKKTPLHASDYCERVQALPENVWFIANSTYTERQLSKLNINPDKILLKRFGVPVASRPRSHSSHQVSRLLYLGRLVDFKGPLETARAFHRIVDQHSGVKLQIAGGGDLENELVHLIEQLDLPQHVCRYGAVDSRRAAELRSTASVFTAHNQTGRNTGQCEAFGVSLLEAMGEGIPVVTGRSGGISDFIQHQENGMLFEPGDIDSHAAMLDELLSSPAKRQTLGEAAWQTVRDHYQPHHEQEDLIRIFDHVNHIGACPTLRRVAAARAA